MAANDEFRRKFAAFVERAKGNQEQVVRKVAMDLLRSLVLKSPVDTGRFRGNWQVQYTLQPRTLGVVDRAGTTTIATATQDLSYLRLGETIYLVNHLPYAVPLEYGHSKQAPVGMVRLTVTEFDQFLTRAVGDLKQ